jgi:excisionase family DNA binding protein
VFVEEFEMPILEITRETIGWREQIEAHLAAGDTVTVRITTPYLTLAQAAASLNVSRSALEKWIEQGRIATVRDGADHRITVREVERFRAERLRGIADDDLPAILDDLYHG